MPLWPHSGWYAMHQHPPKMPLLRSTSSAKASQVESSSGRTVYDTSNASGDRLRRFGEQLGQGHGLGEHRPVTGVDVDEVETLGTGQLGQIAAVDPLLGLCGTELRAHEHHGDG